MTTALNLTPLSMSYKRHLSVLFFLLLKLLSINFREIKLESYASSLANKGSPERIETVC